MVSFLRRFGTSLAKLDSRILEDLARFAMTSESAEWKCDPEIVSYDEEGSNFEKLWEAHGYIEMVEEIARPGCSPETLTISLASVKDLVDRHLSIPPKR
ncbi:hypothetical protein MLD38_019178 [Melastoma candidum]|uniref:Uncharacterized protein n=1 Tax=Melastoma candidum TaxID=119954 RepID=A0ACB9QZM7_9MYRT|nr:hypothetical protein MLD38_019178 [Melastoma candidum]